MFLVVSEKEDLVTLHEHYEKKKKKKNKQKKKNLVIIYTITDMKICHFGFRIINSTSKLLDLNTLTPFNLNFFIFHASRKTQAKFAIDPKKKGPLTPSRQAPLSRHHANYIAVSRITP